MIRNEFAKETLRVWTSIETKRVIVHGNRELIRFAAREEKVTRNHLKFERTENIVMLDDFDNFSEHTQNGNFQRANRLEQNLESLWENAEKMLAAETVIDTKVVDCNKGGLIVVVGNLRGFVPSSQISSATQPTDDTSEQRWQKMVGQPISVKIIEVNRKRRRFILSERAANPESSSAIKDRVIGELEEGKVYTGCVTTLADFGAFVNVNGADGLVYLSQLSWGHITHPKEILEVGQEVQVKVININRNKRRFTLSIRALQDDPLKSRIEKFSVGQLVEGLITHLTKFGAFARLEVDIEGLIHISELSENPIKHPKEVLKVGDVKTLRVIRVDSDQHRIGLSIRKVDPAAFAEMD